MTAHMYCWTADLALNPASSDFTDEIRAIYQLPKPSPSPRLVAFVNDLLSRYADLTQTDDTVWGYGPLMNNILGEFINMSLIWSRYVEAAPFVIETAHKHGLHCYDPQGDDFYLAPRR